jgi:competence protein ComEA
MQKIKDYIYYNRKEIITIIICLISFVSFTLFSSKEESIVVNEIIEKEEDKTIKNTNIVVDVKGEIISPGTYEFEEGKRIVDAIEKSGGLTNNADVNSINLSEKLVDEMVIYIPSKEENISSFNNSKKEIIKEEKDSKISINTASITTLMTLKGIGQKKAESIVEYRQQHGPFKNIEEIKNISGIGNSIFDKIKDYIKV